MSIKEIEAEIRKLPLKDRAALARWIVESPSSHAASRLVDRAV